MSEVTYPVVKKVSLEGLSEGWDGSCFAYIIPATYQDQKDLSAADLTNKTKAEQVDYQLNFVRDHFVKGQIRVFNGEDFETADMTKEHTSASVEVTDHLYSAIMGFELDPKDIRKAAAQSALQANDETATATTSSETSVEE